MNTRTIFILAAVAAVVALLAVLAIRLTAAPAAQTDNAYLLSGFADKADRAAEIEIQSATGSIRLRRDADEWTLPDKTGIAAQGDRVRALLIGLATMKPTEPKTSNPDHYARIGVDERAGPESRATLVTVRDADGAQLASLILGDTTDAGRFVRVPGQAQSYLANAAFDTPVETTLWTDRTLLRVDGNRVSSVVIEHPDGEEFAITRSSPDEPNFEIVPMPAGRTLSGPSAATPITRALSNLMFEDVRPATNPLDEETTVSVVYQTFDGLVVSLLVGDTDRERWTTITVSASDTANPPPDYAPLRSLVTGRQFKLPGWAASNITKRVNDFLASESPSEPEAIPALGPVLDPGG